MGEGEICPSRPGEEAAFVDRPVRVVIVDDEMISRGYMELFIKPSRNYEVVAALPLAGNVLDYCREHGAPELLIMDIMMLSGPDGLTTARVIKERYPQTRIILTTSMADADWIEQARAAGVESFWFKTYADRPLLEVMDMTMAGQSVYPDRMPQISLGSMPASELTGQQRRVLRLLTEGLSNREIAERLVVSPYTVKTHLDEIMDRAGIHSRTALVAQAARLGIVVSDAERTKGAEPPNP